MMVVACCFSALCVLFVVLLVFGSEAALAAGGMWASAALGLCGFSGRLPPILAGSICQPDPKKVSTG